ncbi:MAG: DMT family transporter, partial [Alphaproteobacteria bacterium]|nr:DMT family transporter [Alphaproteobacteria bacterium]
MSNSDAGGVPADGPENGRTARVAFIALLAGAIGIAFAPIFVRLSELGPSATAFHRLLLAAPFLWLWMGLDRRRAAGTGRKPASARDFGWLALVGLLFAADLGLWHWSIRLTSVANATLLANAAPIFVTLAGWLVLGQRFTPVFLAGMAVALLGAVLLMGSSVTLGLDHLLGDGLGLATAVFYAGYMLAVKKVRADFSTATVMAWSAAAGAIALLPLALVSGESIIATTATGWGVLLALALLSHVGGQSLIAYALAHLPAAFSSVSLLLQPVAAALLAWLILSEALGLLQG